MIEQEALTKRIDEMTKRFIVCDGPRCALCCSLGTGGSSEGTFVHVGEYVTCSAIRDTADEAIDALVDALKLDPDKLMLIWRVRPEIVKFERGWKTYARMIMYGVRS